MTKPTSENPRATAGESDRLTVTFFVPHAWPAISPGARGEFGGIETRAWAFAVALATFNRIACRFVVNTRLPVRNCLRQGVTIVPRVEPLRTVRLAVSRRVELLRTFPWIRVVNWHWSLLWQIPLLATARLFRRRTHPAAMIGEFTRQSGSVFCTFGASLTSTSVVRAASARGCPSILFLAWDGDLDPAYLEAPEMANIYGEPGGLCAAGIREADCVIAQHEQQAQWLRDRYDRVCEVIENPIDLRDWIASEKPSSRDSNDEGSSRYCLWVGRADEHHKCPHRLVQIARKCPGLQFLMVMNGGDPGVERSIRKSLPANVRLQGGVPFARMRGLYQGAFALVNTSEYEGTPNVFLQAMAMGIPVLSLKTGTSLLERSRGGIVCDGNEDELAQLIRTASTSIPQGVDLQFARQHLAEHHDLQTQAEKFADLAHRVVAEFDKPSLHS